MGKTYRRMPDRFSDMDDVPSKRIKLKDKKRSDINSDDNKHISKFKKRHKNNEESYYD